MTERQLPVGVTPNGAATRIIPGDIFKWFDRATTRPSMAGEYGADIVFLDPPYRFVRDRPDELIQLTFHFELEGGALSSCGVYS